MFCPKCGSEGSQSFCPKCGTRLHPPTPPANEVAPRVWPKTKAGRLLFVGFLSFAIVWVIVMAIRAPSGPRSSSTPTPVAPALTSVQNSAGANVRAVAQGDEAAKLIGKCGKPDQDFTKSEGGQPIRHIIYKKQNIELMYSRQGVPAWVTVGIFKANADENMDKEEANRRLPCAAGSIHTVLDQP
jgi:hypothetical protein